MVVNMINQMKLNIIQVCVIIIIINNFLNYSLIDMMVLDKAGRDSWLSILFTAFLCIIWIPILYYLTKNTNQMNLHAWLKEKYNSVIAWVLIIFICIYLLSMMSIVLIDTSNWALASYLPNTPSIFVVTLLVILCALGAYLGIRSIAITTQILLPAILIMELLLTFANIPTKDYSLLRPIMEHGISPALSGLLYTSTGIFQFLLIIFFKQHISSKITIKALFIIAGITIMLSMLRLTDIITVFGPVEAVKLRYPNFLIWNVVTITNYVKNIQFFSIYQWLAGSFISISTWMFLITDLLSVKTAGKHFIVIVIISLVIIGTTQLPISDISFTNFLMKYYFPILLIFSFFLSLVLGILIFLSNKKMRRKT
jgi:spore germination protein KB